jgi:hypothetical protein
MINITDAPHCEPAGPIGPADEGERPDPIDLLREYLTQHVVSVCGGRCRLCRGAYAHLVARGVAVEWMQALLPEVDRAPRPGRGR